MNVSLRQLLAFVAVAKWGSFTEAAERLFISQSALSGLIKELEQILGVQVIHRTTRKTQLSDVGATFLPLAERLLQDLDKALQTMTDIKELKTGIVRVAVPQLMACTLMPEVIAAFARLHPGVQVRMIDSVVEGVLARVATGDVDFAIGPHRAGAGDIEARELFEMPFLAVFPAGHPLGKLRRVTWEQLGRFPLISLQGEYTRMLSADLFASSRRLTLNPAHEVAFVTTALSMVSAGLGVTTCLPYAQSLLDLQQLQTRELVSPKLTRKFFVWARKDRDATPAACAFRDFLLDYVAQAKGAKPAD